MIMSKEFIELVLVPFILIIIGIVLQVFVFNKRSNDKNEIKK